MVIFDEGAIEAEVLIRAGLELLGAGFFNKEDPKKKKKIIKMCFC